MNNYVRLKQFLKIIFLHKDQYYQISCELNHGKLNIPDI